jgi:hypothetical protein
MLNEHYTFIYKNVHILPYLCISIKITKEKNYLIMYLFISTKSRKDKLSYELLNISFLNKINHLYRTLGSGIDDNNAKVLADLIEVSIVFITFER